MRFVVDANVLFSLSKPSSTSNAILKRFQFSIVAPDFGLLELHKHRKVISEKSGLSFPKIIDSLKEKAVFADVSGLKTELKVAKKIIPDIKDAAYVALSLKLGLAIWSNDRHLKISEVDSFTTKELIELLD